MAGVGFVSGERGGGVIFWVGMGRRQTILRPYENIPDSLSSFVGFIQLKSDTQIRARSHPGGVSPLGTAAGGSYGRGLRFVSLERKMDQQEETEVTENESVTIVRQLTQMGKRNGFQFLMQTTELLLSPFPPVKNDFSF